MKFGKPGEGKFNILRNTRYINLLNIVFMSGHLLIVIGGGIQW